MAEPEKEEKGKDEKGSAKAGSSKAEEPKGQRKEVKVEKEKLRLAGTDLDGRRSVMNALSDIAGIGWRTAHVISELAQVPKFERIGNLTEAQLEQLESAIKTMSDVVPPWIVNRQRDWETGVDIHLAGVDVDISRRNDINRMKMIRCYRGIRHESGQKVRGQRTRSNGRSGLTVGVIKKVVRAQMAEKAEKAKKEKPEKS